MKRKQAERDLRAFQRRYEAVVVERARLEGWFDEYAVVCAQLDVPFDSAEGTARYIRALRDRAEKAEWALEALKRSKGPST